MMHVEPGLDRAIKASNVPWVESPQFLAEIQRASLPEGVKQIGIDLATKGYAIFDPEIPDFGKIADGVITSLAPRYAADGRVTNAWEYDRCVKAMALSPKIISLLRTLYRREPLPYQTLNFNKGTEQRTHSDIMHFHSIPARYMCGVWIALEAIDEDNGPLHYYEGSHRLPILLPEDLGLDPDRSIHERYVAYEDYLEAAVRNSGLPRKEITVPRGSAVLWAANLHHGGSPIRDRSRSRHTQVTHYFFEGCQYYAPIQSSPFRGSVQFLHFKDIRTGKKVGQPDLPLLNLNRLTSRHFYKRLRKMLWQ